MKKTIYLKLLIAYLIFAVFGFVIIATFVQQMTLNRFTQDKAEDLYRAAQTLAGHEALALYRNELSLNSMKDAIDSAAAILDARVQIINPSGLIILDSDSPVNVENPVSIDGFDITSLSGSFYAVSNFYKQFDTPMLSVASTNRSSRSLASLGSASGQDSV